MDKKKSKQFDLTAIKKWQEQNFEKVIEKNKRLNKQKKVREYQKKYHAKLYLDADYKEKMRARQKAWREANKDIAMSVGYTNNILLDILERRRQKGSRRLCLA